MICTIRSSMRISKAIRNRSGIRSVARPVIRPAARAVACAAMDGSILEAAGDPSTSALAQQIFEAEAELAGLFDSGRPMPSAGMVAKKRKAITEMKELLTAKLNGHNVLVNPDASDDEAERARQLFLEVERSLQRQQRPDSQQMGEYNFELALLEEENERLRETAEMLLQRQQQLEDLAEKHGLITFDDGMLVWTKHSGAPDRPVARVTPSSGEVDMLEKAALSMR